MLFNSFIYFVFLGFVLPIFYILSSKKSKNIFLVVVSYFFYAYWDWRFCSLLAISTMIDFTIGQRLFKTSNIKKRKYLVAISLLSNLGILAFFKYFNFFTDSFQVISELFSLRLDYLHLNVLLPVGISFYTFQTLSYTIDIYRKRLEPCTDFIDFMLFVSFFPQLVAGPIERAKSLLPQLSEKLKASRKQVEEGITLIILGLFRKVMIGDTAGRFVDHIFGDMEAYKSIEVIAALFLFSVQIYADFSGYTHIARGTAKLLGVELMKNFEQPYLSRNITEFWKKWHISLSSWLKDYLYISLGGNRKGNFNTYRNLMITMLLGGLWHGASWNFVIWGALHGIYLSIHKWMMRNKKIHTKNITHFNPRNIFKILITFLLVQFSWIFFRASSWDTTQLFFTKLFFWETSKYTFLFISIVLSYTSITFLFDLLEYRSQNHNYILKIKSKEIRIAILSALLFVTFTYMFQAEPLPFIYFQF